MIECQHFTLPNLCTKFGTTTEAWCSRCHLRQPRGSVLPIADSLPQEFIARVKASVAQTIVPERQPALPITSGQQTPFVARDLRPLHLTNLYAGASLFVILSGPSFNRVDKSLLTQRGIITMGVNNSPATFRPHLWIHGDGPSKFHHGIWLDPGILKIIPRKCFHHNLRIKENGKFSTTERKFNTLPGVVGFERNSNFNPETYLSEPSVNWGNSIRNVRHNHAPHCINIFFNACKIPYLLGFRTVYFLGADFHMTADQPYSFKESKSAISSNNGTYMKLNSMLNQLRPHFDKAGYQVFNATEGSRCTAFERISLKDAVKNSLQGFPSEPWDTDGWYAK